MPFRTFTAAALAALLAGIAVPSTAATVSQIVVFGDGNVDIGRAASETDPRDGVIPAPSTVGGRASDGWLLPEYVADQLGVPQVNYGVEGATTGTTTTGQNDLDDLYGTGLLSQVQEFTDSLGGALADSEALYVIWAGAADLIGVNTSNTAAISAAITRAQTNLDAAVRALAASGADHIVLATAPPRPDVSDADEPIFEPNFFEKADAATRELNATITELAADLNADLSADIGLFDSYGVIRGLIDGSGTNGFDVYSHRSSAYCVNNVDCSGLINWNANYKTTAAHGALADSFSAQFNLGAGTGGDTPAPVPLPASVILLGGALAGISAIGGFRRRRPVPGGPAARPRHM
ncbi:MAG: SGNH/GDSL hydrolase family protein [Pseudomonadota bacterium]